MADVDVTRTRLRFILLGEWHVISLMNPRSKLLEDVNARGRARANSAGGSPTLTSI